MGFFENCDPDQRFTSSKFGWTPRGRFALVFDFDQRRAIKISMTEDIRDEDFIFETMAKHLDSGAVHSESVCIQVSSDGNELIDQGSQVEDDYTMIPCYWTRDKFSPDLPTIRRSDLIELDRLGLQVDRVAYEVAEGHKKEVAFKYLVHENNIGPFWEEINCVIGIHSRGPHPNIVSCDRLVTETVKGTIDYLNLELGIIHSDILSWNVLIDAETDNLLLFDFKSAFPLGEKPEISDVDLAVVAMSDVITRNLGEVLDCESPYEVDGAQLLAAEVWDKDPEVDLDAGVSEFHRVLKESEMRQRLIMAGQPSMAWQRPSSRELGLPENKRKVLLANGQFA
ncbi:hypothetical protein B0T21DRAFT_416265 [Apiosordaria backusii]|uniref:Uncharacterized protein n=1 Tax=Apiosordaria backusii TaxID=314023 RepID=A0AA40A420_9PEZI|nr:hypothetical protein B0T21DRAFT_416265 [Apiosordaria backusii]